MMSRVHALDLRIDVWVERIRGPQLDPVFYGLSSAADHGLLWLLIGSSRAARRGDPAIALRMGATLGIESLLTNGPIKAMFRRVRPETDHPPEGPLPYGMHRPLTSSFPSGHAASAFTAATLLAGGPATPLWFALAAAVASSRVYTRMHHTSDIVAGAALGIVLGTVARRVLPLDS
jgi:undecaprenyl-diphosphatase